MTAKTVKKSASKKVKIPKETPLYTDEITKKLIYPVMENRAVTEYTVFHRDLVTNKIVSKETKKFTGYKLETNFFYMQLHTAFRKAIHSNMSCIAYSTLSTMKDEHRLLLIDTFTKMLPVCCDADDDNQVKFVCDGIAHATEQFAHRLEWGYGYGVPEKDTSLSYRIYEDYKNNNSVLYRNSIDNLKMAIKEDYEQNKKCFSYFTQFLYINEEEEK